MNIWNDIDATRISADNFTAVIEIPKGCKTKYELDKQTGMLKLDRILHTSTHYPASYGFIPRTYAEDCDPLDVLVICSENIYPLTLVNCYPIGVISMVDSGENDEKIIAIPFKDPVYNGYKDISELPKHIFDEMSHFFTVYKNLEGKKTEIKGIQGAKEAVKIIEDGRLDAFVKERYSSYDTGIGADIVAGRATMEQLEQYALEKGDVMASVKSGRQEYLENIFNSILFE